MYAETTIIAPATPHGSGGISVIRISGKDCLRVVRENIACGCNRIINNPRYATTTGFLSNGGTEIDRVVVTYFKSPHSYTGEDVLEISCHGNPNIVQKIISTCLKNGAEIAEGGEFTKRAYLNNKMDLVQAEAVGDLINSKSEEGAELNYKNVSGGLSFELSSIKDRLVSLLSSVEFNLDISEEELEPDYLTNTEDMISEISLEVNRLLEGYQRTRLLTSGASVVIAGAPNVGKSTLLNTLSNTKRAIVSSGPGTTRDSLDVTLLLDGTPVRLIDTAGIRETDEPVEKEGVKRTRSHIKEADLSIMLSAPDIIENPPGRLPKNTLSVLNKSDLLNNNTGINGFDCIVSAKNKTGVDNLLNIIKEKLSISPALSDSAALTSARQRDSLLGVQSAILRCVGLINNSPPQLELLAADIRSALDSLDTILGKTTADDVLNSIFKDFCVGK